MSRRKLNIDIETVDLSQLSNYRKKIVEKERNKRNPLLKAGFGHKKDHQKSIIYNIIYALLKAEGRTASAKQLSERTGNSPKIIFENESKLKKWVVNETNLGFIMVRSMMLSLKMKGAYTFNKETGEVHVEIIPDDLMDYCTIIPNYMKKDFIKDNKKYTWTVNCQLVFDYLNRFKHCLKKATENDLFTRDYRELKEVMKRAKNGEITEIEMKEKIQKIQQREKLCFDSITPKAQLYLKSRTIAKNIGLTVDEVRKVLRQFRVFFGIKSWRKPTETEILTRVDYCSKSYTIDIPERNILRKMIEKFEQSCDKVTSRIMNLSQSFVYI